MTMNSEESETFSEEDWDSLYVVHTLWMLINANALLKIANRDQVEEGDVGISYVYNKSLNKQGITNKSCFFNFGLF